MTMGNGFWKEELERLLSQLRSERMRLKMTTYQLADETHGAQSAVCQSLNGVHTPTLTTAIKLADALGMRVVLLPHDHPVCIELDCGSDDDSSS